MQKIDDFLMLWILSFTRIVPDKRAKMKEGNKKC
jgi:hypothetical protein